MRKIEFCRFKDCGRWRELHWKHWTSAEFRSEPDERLGWKMGLCNNHTEASMTGTVGEYYDEDGQNEDVRPPIVVYCLEDGCDLTAWYGAECWEISKDRAEGLETGRYTSMMKPYCPKHEAEKKANARKAS